MVKGLFAPDSHLFESNYPKWLVPYKTCESGPVGQDKCHGLRFEAGILPAISANIILAAVQS